MVSRKRRRLAPSVTAVAVGILAAVVLASVAYAGIAVLTQSSVITACKKNSTGAARIVDDASQCKSTETALSWNTEGPPGPPGPGGGSLSRLEYVTAGPDSASQDAVEAVCGANLNVVGGAVRNRMTPGIVRSSHPSDGSGTGAAGARGWYGAISGGSGPFAVVAICAPADATEFRSAGGQYGGQYGG